MNKTRRYGKFKGSAPYPLPSWWTPPLLATKFYYRPPNLFVKEKRSVKRDFSKSYQNQKYLQSPVFHQQVLLKKAVRHG